VADLKVRCQFRGLLNFVDLRQACAISPKPIIPIRRIFFEPDLSITGVAVIVGGVAYRVSFAGLISLAASSAALAGMR
jgi:hypothetical protein